MHKPPCLIVFFAPRATVRKGRSLGSWHFYKRANGKVFRLNQCALRTLLTSLNHVPHSSRKPDLFRGSSTHRLADPNLLKAQNMPNGHLNPSASIRSSRCQLFQSPNASNLFTGSSSNGSTCTLPSFLTSINSFIRNLCYLLTGILLLPCQKMLMRE